MVGNLNKLREEDATTWRKNIFDCRNGNDGALKQLHYEEERVTGVPGAGESVGDGQI